MTNPPESCNKRQSDRERGRERGRERADDKCERNWRQKLKAFAHKGKTRRKIINLGGMSTLSSRSYLLDLQQMLQPASRRISVSGTPNAIHWKKPVSNRELYTSCLIISCCNFLRCSVQRHLGICLPATELPSNDGQKHLVGVS